MIVLQLIAFIFIVGLLAIIVMGVGMLWRVRNMFDQLRGRTHTQSRRTSATTLKDEVIDRRDPAQANKKIFGKDEGEYVDFVVEEDDSKNKGEQA